MRYTDMVACYQHYIDKSREIVSLYPDAVVLKTDGWNETLRDCRCGFEFDMPVLTQIGAAEEHCIEYLKDRSELAQERNPSVKVVNADLTKYDYPDEKFDVILDLSTIDHIHPKDLHIVLGKYNKWLKSQGTLLLVVWQNYNKRWREEPVDINPNHQYYFEIADFQQMMKDAGFVFSKPELLLGSKSLPGLFQYVCTKGTV
jgi:SAM-dependent methyltransferase